MIDTITVDKDTTDDELVAAAKLILGRLSVQIGTAATVGILFGTAVLMTVEDSERHAR